MGFLRFFAPQNLKSMIRILANDGIDDDGKLLLEEAGFQVDTKKIAQEDLIKELPHYQALTVRSATKVRQPLIDACPGLKLIARGGVGMDNIDVEYARNKGIEVINTPAASSKSVAELAFAHLFSLVRGLHVSNREMAKDHLDFNDLKKRLSNGIELRGKTMGILGIGRIGQETARIALALGMRVIPVDIMIAEASINLEFYDYQDIHVGLKLESVKMDKMLAEADFISVHIPFAGGKPIIGAEEIKKMKKGVFVLNTARGGAIDETALLNSLEDGLIAGAGIDVFENEPTPRKELLGHPKISVTPHIGANTQEAQTRIGLELAERIIDFFEKK